MTNEPTPGMTEPVATTPPLVANNFRVLWGDKNIRIIFGDQAGVGLPIQWHTQICINPEAVEALEGLLNRLRTQAQKIEIGAPAPDRSKAN